MPVSAAAATADAHHATRDAHIEREGFWPHGEVTPRTTEDASKRIYGVTLRDFALVVIGAAGMWGTQVATQAGMRSDIRDLSTLFISKWEQQSNVNINLQRQIDDWRAETKLNRVNTENQDKEIAELKGLLVGAGIKGVNNAKR